MAHLAVQPSSIFIDLFVEMTGGWSITSSTTSALIIQTQYYRIEIMGSNLEGGWDETSAGIVTRIEFWNLGTDLTYITGLAFKLGDIVKAYNGSSGTGTLNFLLSGNDTIIGNRNGDHIRAGSGDDTIAPSGGGDYIDGGDGTDTIDYTLSPFPMNGARINLSGDWREGEFTTAHDGSEIYLVNIENAVATFGNDTVYGSDVANRLEGRSGNDLLDGRGGHDILIGGAGNDTLLGGDGADQLQGDAGNDSINGGRGFDTVAFSGRLSDYTITANADGSITVTDKRGIDGTDILTGIEVLRFEDVLSYYGDLLPILVHNVSIREDGELDLRLPSDLTRLSGLKIVLADGQNLPAWLSYDPSTNALKGAPPQDWNGELRIRIEGAGDVAARTGEFTIAVAAVNDAPTDVSLSNATVSELAAANTIVGDIGVMDPDAGDSFTYTLLESAGGRFSLRTQDGITSLVVNDGLKLDFEQARTHQVVIKVTDNAGLSYTKALTVNVADVAVEKTLGGTGNDILKGGPSGDTLGGGAGNDKLWGGKGKDVLTGGSGADTFVFDTALNARSNVDTITDFRVKDDSIFLDNAVFSKLGKGSIQKPGALSQAFFTIGPKARDANDYIIYDNRKGVLSYDADGSGPKAAIQFAVLKKGLALTHKDFFVI